VTFPVTEIPEDPSRRGQEEVGATPAQAGSQEEVGATPAQAGSQEGAVTGGRWGEIQAMFVDDPRRSVAVAEGVVNEAISAFIDAARARQASLASAWQGQEAGTEELRVALQDYRAFWNSIAGLPQ
jgi:hypothetical protein